MYTVKLCLSGGRLLRLLSIISDVVDFSEIHISKNKTTKHTTKPADLATKLEAVRNFLDTVTDCANELQAERHDIKIEMMHLAMFVQKEAINDLTWAIEYPDTLSGSTSTAQ